MSPERDVRITDSTLRDGSHAMRHQFTEEQVRGVVHALDAARVEVIEVSHGDGLGGSSFNYGFSLRDEFELIRAAVDEATRAQDRGAATARGGHRARPARGASVRARPWPGSRPTAPRPMWPRSTSGRPGSSAWEAVGFLMLAHRIGLAELAAQARIMVDSGAQCVYVVDSAGALVLADAQSRVLALIKEIGAEAEAGFHGHQNLSLGIANSVLAAQAGIRRPRWTGRAVRASARARATRRPRCPRPRSTGSASAPGVDVPGAMAAAEEVVRPFPPRLPWVDRNALIQGLRRGVRVVPAARAEQVAERYGVPAHEIPQKGRMRPIYVGGQEDLIIEIAPVPQQEVELGAAGAR